MSLYKETVKPILAQIFSSKKALATIAGAIVWALAQAGVGASPAAVLPLLGIIGTYVLGQGMADIGKEKALAEIAGVKEMAAVSLGKPQQPVESE